MTGKYTKKEKIILIITLLLMLCSIIIRIILGIHNMGIIVSLGFINLLLYVIFLVAALFPADWNMTDKQKAKIKDKEKYQSRYRLIMVIIAFILCFAVDMAIILIQ